jgi:hypothetical protein
MFVSLVSYPTQTTLPSVVLHGLTGLNTKMLDLDKLKLAFVVPLLLASTIWFDRLLSPSILSMP